MNIGLFAATYLDLPLEDVCRKAADLGYQSVEIPAFKEGNSHLAVDDIIQRGRKINAHEGARRNP